MVVITVGMMCLFVARMDGVRVRQVAAFRCGEVRFEPRQHFRQASRIF